MTDPPDYARHRDDCPGGPLALSEGTIVIFPSREDLPKYLTVNADGESGAHLPTRTAVISTCTDCGAQEGGEAVDGTFVPRADWVPVATVFERMLNPPPDS